MKKVVMHVAPAYEEYLLDWNYRQYLLIGGWSAGKTVHTIYKILLKLFEENRRAIVAAPTKQQLLQLWDVFAQVLDDLGVLGTKTRYEKDTDVVTMLYEPWRAKPMRIKFHNGSKIMFRTLDQPYPSTFFYGVSILWVAYAQDGSKQAIDELKSRMRWGGPTKQYILTADATGKDNWLYKEYFRVVEQDDYERVIVDEYELYDKHVVVHDNTYYLHTTASDNPWLSVEYLQRLNHLFRTDRRLYQMARWGRFVNVDTRLFPHLEPVRVFGAFAESVTNLVAAGQWYCGVANDWRTVVVSVVDTRLSSCYIVDVFHLDGDTMVDREKSLGMKEGQVPIMCSNSEDKPEAMIRLLDKGYNLISVQRTMAERIQMLQQFRRIQVHPNYNEVYQEIKGLSYCLDAYGCAQYTTYNMEPHYVDAIGCGLCASQVPYIKQGVKTE